MTLSTKYLNSVAWRTYFKGVSINSYATLESGAKWDATVYPIDDNDNGANPIVLNTSLFIVDNAGHLFSITAINVGSDPYRITVSDDFNCGFAPVMGYEGYVYKSAYKGYAPFISPVFINRLDKVARDYINHIEKSIFWANDPNTLLIPFTATKTPTISNYQLDQSINGKIVNLAEDYPIPKFLLAITISPTKIQYYEKAPIINLIDGNIDNVVFNIPTASSGNIYISN